MGAQTIVFDSLQKQCRTAPRGTTTVAENTVTIQGGAGGKPARLRSEDEEEGGGCHGVSLGQVA